MTQMRGLVGFGHPAKNDRPVLNNASEVVDGGSGQEDFSRSVRRFARVGSSMGPLAFLRRFPPLTSQTASNPLRFFVIN